MKIQNLLASGCSFTQDGIGGVPPTATSNGGNSFIENAPGSWASIVAQKLAPQSFVNLASSGRGLVMINRTIQAALTKFAYSPDNTLVLFNVTSIDRLDIECRWDNAEKCNYIPWNNNIFDFTYIKWQGAQWKHKFLDLDIKEVEQASLDALEDLFNFLDRNHYRYLFTMMNNYMDLPMVAAHRDFAVKLDPGIGMSEFVQANNQLDVDGQHPSLQGHYAIAQQVLEQIKKSTP